MPFGGVGQKYPVYSIYSPITVPSNTEIRGAESTIIEFGQNCKMPVNRAMFEPTSVNNIKFTKIKFRGNQESQTYAVGIPNPGHPDQSAKKYGKQLNTFIYVKYCSNVTVSKCDFLDNLGDGLRVTNSNNIEFSYNTASMGGHDVLFCLRSSGVRAHHNNIKTLVNSAVRLLDVNHARIYNNIIEWVGPRDAGPAIQIQHDTGTMTDIEVCGNKIYSSCGPGLWLIGKTSGNEELYFHHNYFANCGDNRISWVSGIIASGYDNTRIENNLFDGCYRAAVCFFAVNSAWSTDADAALTGNILMNSRISQLDKIGPYGLENTISKQRISSYGNCYYNNNGGDIKGSVNSQNDLHKDPSPSFGDWYQVDGKWECKEVSPQEMGNIPNNDYNGTGLVSDEVIEQFEFNDIFDIFSMKVTDNVYSGEKPENYSFVNTVNVTILNNSFNPQTRYHVPIDDSVIKICYEYEGNKSWHFIKALVSGNTELETFDTWKSAEGTGSLGNSFNIPKALDPEKAGSVKITVYTLYGKTTIENYNVVYYDETASDFINPFAFLGLAILGLFGVGIMINIKSMRWRWK